MAEMKAAVGLAEIEGMKMPNLDKKATDGVILLGPADLKDFEKTKYGRLVTDYIRAQLSEAGVEPSQGNVFSTLAVMQSKQINDGQRPDPEATSVKMEQVARVQSGLSAVSTGQSFAQNHNTGQLVVKP